MGSLHHVLRRLLFQPTFASRTFTVGRTLRFPNTLRILSRNMSYQAVEKGEENTTAYRVYFKNADGVPISPLHDIPLIADESKQLYNMIVEIPRWTNAKMEINLKEALNPIKQDIKKGKLRFVANSFPHHGYIWNYGAMPQTWENPEIKDEHTNYKGDNDPIDIMEIGSRVLKRGDVLQVKPLGCIALIDEGETDWKVISINKDDPLFESINDIMDIEKFLPGLLKATLEWLRIYKIPDGKPENKFGLNAEFKDKAFVLKKIQETHEHWKGLISRSEDTAIVRANTTLNESNQKITVGEAQTILGNAPAFAHGKPVDASVDKWHFLHLTS